jgi:hypothetical protein
VDWKIPGRTENVASGLGHAFVWEHESEGVRFLDPQKGIPFPEKTWNEVARMVDIQRLDDKPFLERKLNQGPIADIGYAVRAAS